MDYPPAVLEKAQRLAQLLQRVAAGESLDEANAALGFSLDPAQLARWQAKYEAGGYTWAAVIDGRHGHSRKAHTELREWLYARKRQDESKRAPQLATAVETQFGVRLSAGHVNHLLRQRGLSAPPGRPPKQLSAAAPSETPAALVDNAGLFLLEAAKAEMGVVDAVEETVRAARDAYLVDQPPQHLHHLAVNRAALWSQIDHLLYLPLLGLTRPRDLYYYQGAGLTALYGFTYKYLTLEQVLGQLTRIQVGAPLAERLAQVYAQAWYPGPAPLTLFADWHVKPHWTKSGSQAGHVTMWGRVMPGTKQLILTGPQGRLLGGMNYAIDTHMSHILVDLEAAWEQTLARPIVCTITDSEGGGLPLGERYAAAHRNYISVLPQGRAYRRADFVLTSRWELVQGDPQRQAARARWADAERAAQDPRQLVLLRPVNQAEPTRIYTGQFAGLTAGEVPWLHRRRWPHNELRIRDLIHGANLNANYGYTYTPVANRTRQRQWDKAQVRVTASERRLSQHQDAVRHLRQRLGDLQEAYAAQQRDRRHQLAHRRLDLQRRQQQGQATTRAQQRVAYQRRELAAHTQRFRRQQRRLLRPLYRHQTQARQERARLRQRRAARDAIDTTTQCRERDLEKDQIMLNWQILLANLHDWVARTYLAPTWRNLSLAKATPMIYRKAGRVTWHEDRIEVELEPYRYRDQQQAMEATCARFNAAQVRWRDGRLLRLSVVPPG